MHSSLHPPFPPHLKAERMLKKTTIFFSFFFLPFLFFFSLSNFGFPLAEHFYWRVLCNESATDMETSLLCLECHVGHLFELDRARHGHGKNKAGVCFSNDPSSANGAQAVRLIPVQVNPGASPSSWELTMPLSINYPRGIIGDASSNGESFNHTIEEAVKGCFFFFPLTALSCRGHGEKFKVPQEREKERWFLAWGLLWLPSEVAEE